MRDDDLFELARVDVISAPQDHVLFTVDYRKIAVLVHDTYVAGVKPTVGERLLGRLGSFVITLHYVVAADDDLAAGSARHFAIVVVKAFDLDPHQRLADGTGLRRFFKLIETCDR